MRKGRANAVGIALRFYGSEDCIVSGPPRVPEHRTVWHHLDENSSNWVATNIVRLRSDLNDAIERHRRQPSTTLPFELTVDHLLFLSHEDYGQGFFARGYGCARLGAFITDRHLGDWDAVIRLAISCLLNLRPLDHLAFALDTFRRTIRPVLKAPETRRQVQFRTLDDLVSEIGTYFIDYGFGPLGLRWKTIAGSLLDKERRLSKTDVGVRARILQHKGIANVIIGETSRAKALMALALERYPKDSSRGGGANDLLWKLKQAMREGDLDAAEAVETELQRLGVTRDIYYVTGEIRTPRQVGWYICCESLAQLADLSNQRGDVDAAMDLAAAADLMYSHKRIQPSASIPSFSLGVYRQKYKNATPGKPRNARRLAHFARSANEILEMIAADGPTTTLTKKRDS